MVDKLEADEIIRRMLEGRAGARDEARRFLATPANGEQVERIVEQAVEAWHNSDATLTEWLGWTDAEYATWCTDPKAVPRLPKYFAATLPTPTEDARERVKVLEEALRNLLDFIGPKDMRVYATDLVVLEARAALGNKETDRHG